MIAVRILWIPFNIVCHDIDFLIPTKFTVYEFKTITFWFLITHLTTIYTIRTSVYANLTTIDQMEYALP